ncbi:MAG: hypothetical protein M0D55_14265 [Elusimicrobiota bacterium]|nr:MAG: hypothetical protein M0D55_14265 [Elusimicrobiota bacterium]
MRLLALLLALPAAAAAGQPRVYWSGDRAAVVSERLVEYYKLPAGAAVSVEDGKAVFKKGKTVLTLVPESKRPFASDLLPPGHKDGNRGAFILCAGGGAHFCGAVTVAGKEIFRLNSRPASGALQPAGLSDDGSEALFAAVKTEPKREVTEWLIRTKKGAQRWAIVSDPEAERLLKRFQGTNVLPAP